MARGEWGGNVRRTNDLWTTTTPVMFAWSVQMKLKVPFVANVLEIVVFDVVRMSLGAPATPPKRTSCSRAVKMKRMTPPWAISMWLGAKTTLGIVTSTESAVALPPLVMVPEDGTVGDLSAQLAAETTATQNRAERSSRFMWRGPGGG